MSTIEQAVEDLLSEQDWTGKIFSDGWVDAPETIETIEPATGDVLGTAGVGERRVGRSGDEVGGARSARMGGAADGRSRGGHHAAQPSCSSATGPRSAAGWCASPGAIPPKVEHEIGASIGQLNEAASLISASARAGAAVADSRDGRRPPAARRSASSA